MLELGKRHGVPVAALVGTRDHALAQVRAGVDILVVAGGEAGGHCGEVATMVLVPIRRLHQPRPHPVDAARDVQQLGVLAPVGHAPQRRQLDAEFVADLGRVHQGLRLGDGAHAGCAPCANGTMGWADLT